MNRQSVKREFQLRDFVSVTSEIPKRIKKFGSLAFFFCLLLQFAYSQLDDPIHLLFACRLPLSNWVGYLGSIVNIHLPDLFPIPTWTMYINMLLA